MARFDLTSTSPDGGPDGGSARAGAELAAGTRLGRFTVERLLGRGGMGVVYQAHDPELGRRVALKLLSAERSSPNARARLLREAQAMARLQHPNVVVVFDVGAHGDQVFLAMELVEGQTLQAWLTAAPRPLAAVLHMFLQAGRGLAAAHAAGFVHRDFKPANVLVDEGGRARVMDFGLASAPGESASGEAVPLSGEEDLTATGAVLGTPAYMAPEQRSGGTVGPQADQYSFCLSLKQGLGSLPVPAAVARVVERGLAERARDRHPTMDVLLTALERAVPGRRGAIVAGVAALALLGAGLVAATRDGAGEARCAHVAERLTGVWDPARKQALRAALAATGVAYAEKSGATIEALLDGYAADWVARNRAVCTGPPVERDLRLACLDQRLANLGGVVNVISGSGPAGVARAADAAAALNDLALCDRPNAGGEPVPQDRKLREKVGLERARLAVRRSLNIMGQYEGGVEETQAIADDARALGYRPLEAEALSEQARILYQTDELARAEKASIAAAEAAKESRYELLEARAWRQLVYVYGNLYRYDDARRASRYARAALTGLGPEADGDRISLDSNEALNLAGEKRHEEALTMARRALALGEKVRSPHDPSLAAQYASVAYVLLDMGRLDEAEALYLRALATFVRVSGEEHPQAAKMLNNLGSVAYKRGDKAKALEYYQRALATKLKLHGPENLDVAYTWLNVGIVLGDLGRPAEAMPLLERARDVFVVKLGPDELMTADALAELGEAHLALGQPAAAVEPLARALEIREKQKAEPAVLDETRALLARARGVRSDARASR